MRNSQTIEGGHGRVRSLLAPVMAVTLGGAMLTGGRAEASETAPQAVPAAVAAAAMGHEVETTITGTIETLKGEPVGVRNKPFGEEIGRYKDGSEVQILCQDLGPNAPGDPKDFGKPPLADTTWLQLADPASGVPFSPQRWVPMNPVFPKGGPIPSCPR